MMQNKTIYCYLDDMFHGCLYLGTLYVQSKRGREAYSFEWSSDRLEEGRQVPFVYPRLCAERYDRQVQIIVSSDCFPIVVRTTGDASS